MEVTAAGAQRRHHVWFALAAAGLATLPPAPAAGFSTGITEHSGKQGPICNACHGGGEAPEVRFEGPPQVAPRELATFRFVVRSRALAQAFAGFNVAASAGQLDVSRGEGARRAEDEITHATPKENDDADEAGWTFTWRAPAEPGRYTLFGAGNSVDGDRTSSGDRAAATTLTVVVGAPETATPTPTATPSPTRTPTPTFTEPPAATFTPTPLPAACVGDCNHDRDVTVDELVRGVNIALGTIALSGCPAFDSGGDGLVTVDELVQAVRFALDGCP